MTAKSYKIIFADNRGSFAAEALAASCEGSWRDNVERYNGKHDLAFIDVPAENAAYLEELLEADDNVISFSKDDPENRSAKSRGRPAEMSGGKRINVYLDAASLERASQLGCGNVSEGIRKALAQ